MAPTIPRRYRTADLVVSLTTTEMLVGTGEEYVYRVRVTNVGAVPCGSVSFRLDLPPGVHFRSATSNPYVVVDAGPSVVGFHKPNAMLLPGGYDEAAITVVAPLTPGSIAASVTVDPSNVIPETSGINNTSTHRLAVEHRPDVRVTISGPSTVTLQQRTLFAGRIHNAGLGTATSVEGQLVGFFGVIETDNDGNDQGFRWERVPTDIGGQPDVKWYFSGGTLRPGDSHAFGFWFTPTVAGRGPDLGALYFQVGCNWEHSKAKSNNEVEKALKFVG